MDDEGEFLQQGAVQGPCLFIFLGVPPGACLLLVALIHATDLEHYCEFKVSSEQVMFITCLLISSVLIERNLALVCASGKCE
jgi:hypothetical protein